MGLRTKPARSTPNGSKRDSYDAFISYSHAVDAHLSRSLQAGLHRFAKPLYRLRALRVFRDEGSLSVNPALWTSITTALDGTRWFLLLASPEAARSEWVGREAEYWCAHTSPERIMIVLTSGTISWDDAAGDFDWDKTDALPPTLRGVFDEEPRYVDVTWARDLADVSLSNPRFVEVIADVAAPLHGRPKDELFGEDVRQHRKTRHIARAAVVTLTVLLLAAVTAALVAVDQRETARAERDRAEEQARIALSRQLAAEAVALPDNRFDLALLVAAQAYEVEPTAQARGALLSVLARSPHLAGYLPNTEGATTLAVNPRGTTLLVAPRDRPPALWSLRTLRRMAPLESPADVTAAAFGPDGRMVATGSSDSTLRIWDARTGRQQARMSLGSAVRAVAFDPVEEQIAAADDEGAIAVFSTAGGEPQRAFSSGLLAVSTLVFKRSALVVADGQGNLTIWDVGAVPAQRLGDDIAGGGQPMVSAFSADARLFAAVTLGQQTPYLFDVAARSFLFGDTLVGPTVEVDAMAFSADAKTLVTVGGGRITLWDVASGEALPDPVRGAPATSWAEPSGNIVRGALAVAADARRLVVGGEQGVAVWDLRGHTLRSDVRVEGITPLADVPNVARGAASAAFSPNGELLAWTIASSRGLEVVVWNLHADREVLRVAQEKVVGFSPNSATLATGSFLDEGFTLVDVAAGTTRAVDELPWDGQPQEGAQDDADPWVAAHGGLGASIAFDGTVTLWDTQRRQPLGTVAVPGAFDFSALAFDPTGGRLAVASPGGALSLIDTDVMSWRAKACALAARSLTRAEWNQFFGPTVAYAPAC